ncbi:hypothetical protein Tco_1283773 [Tanacetum coccineum]
MWEGILVRPEEDNPRSNEQKGLRNLRSLRRVLQGLGMQAYLVVRTWAVYRRGEGAPSRGITNLGLEREIRNLSMDRVHRWLRLGVNMDRHKSSRNMQTTGYERLSMVREKRTVRREVSPHVSRRLMASLYGG